MMLRKGAKRRKTVYSWAFQFKGSFICYPLKACQAGKALRTQEMDRDRGDLELKV